MRETRQSGSEGGAAQLMRRSYPYVRCGASRSSEVEDLGHLEPFLGENLK